MVFSHQHQRAVLDASRELIMILGPDLQLAYINRMGRRMLRIAEDHDLTQAPLNLPDLLAPAARAAVAAALPALLDPQGELHWEQELEFCTAEGEQVPCHLSLITQLTPERTPEHLTAIAHDLRMWQHFEAQERRTTQLFESAIEGIMITDSKARILQVNNAFCDITGYSRAEVLGNTPKVLRSDHHDDSFYHAMWQSIEEQDHWQGEVWNRRKNGSAYLQWMSISCIRNPQGDIESYISIFHDLTELRAKEAEIKHLVHHDPLTRLGNRHLFEERLAHALRQARRQREKVALLVLDLGNIKLINDSLGYTWCDHMIRHQSERLYQRVGDSHTLARIGADEFALLIENCDAVHDISQLALDLRQCLRAPVDIGGQQISLSPSVGVAFFPQDAIQADALLTSAQSALAEAKASGRDTFRFFNAQMNREARVRLTLEQALRNAVQNGDLSVHYQPKIRLSDSRIFGAEALLRWHDPELGPQSPAVFIPLAEESGLIIEIGAWVLTNVCQTLARWHQEGLTPPRIAVNISVQQLEQEDFPEWLEALVAEHQLCKELLELEITESSLMKNEKRTLDVLQRLREKGFRIALDDFGTGYSSLSYLHKLPLTTLKIDKSFIQNMGENPVSRNIVQSIVQLGQNLNLDLVAEGVETPRQAESLRQMGCQQAQGYHYYRPMSGPQFTDLL